MTDRDPSTQSEGRSAPGPTADAGDDPGERRAASRAGLLPEEEAAGSDDPDSQAREILRDSDERTLDRGAAPGSRVEHRSSEDVVEPD